MSQAGFWPQTRLALHTVINITNLYWQSHSNAKNEKEKENLSWPQCGFALHEILMSPYTFVSYTTKVGLSQLCCI